MSYTRKTEDVYDLQTNYGYGWETESTYYKCDYENPYKAAKRDSEEYRMNGCQVRIIKRRERLKPRVVVKTEYGTYKITSVAMSRYREDNSLAIELWCDDGPFARLTVCLLDKLKENESYVDTNNCPWAEDFIREYKLGEIVGYKASGYCLYPKVAFDLDRLRNVF